MIALNSATAFAARMRSLIPGLPEPNIKHIGPPRGVSLRWAKGEGRTEDMFSVVFWEDGKFNQFSRDQGVFDEDTTNGWDGDLSDMEPGGEGFQHLSEFAEAV